jgi:hypothetical protein
MKAGISPVSSIGAVQTVDLADPLGELGPALVESAKGRGALGAPRVRQKFHFATPTRFVSFDDSVFFGAAPTI